MLSHCKIFFLNIQMPKKKLSKLLGDLLYQLDDKFYLVNMILMVFIMRVY